MMKKDIILKDITKSAIREVLKYIIKIEVDDFEFLDIEFSKIESRQSDILIKADQKIIHVEFQSSNDKDMLFRMLRYYTEIQSRYPKTQIYQYVLYIGKQKMSMQNVLKKHNIDYFYDIIDLKTLDCGEFLEIDKPEALMVAILCDFKGKNPRIVIKEILSRLVEISQNENEFRKNLLILEELSTSRDLKDVIKEQVMGLMHTKWEDLPSYEIGLEKGIEKGIEKGKKEGILTGKIEAAKIMLKELNLKAEDVADKLHIPLELLKKI